MATPILLSGICGLGTIHPFAFELLGWVSLIVLGAMVVRRVRTGPAPGTAEWLLGWVSGQGLVLLVLVGGRWGAEHPGLEVVGRLLSLGAGLVAATALLLLTSIPASRLGPPQDMGGNPPQEGRGAFVPLTCAMPCIAAALAGLGHGSPLLLGLLGAATLGVLGVLGVRRLRGLPPPDPWTLSLALLAAEGLALACLAGGHLASWRPGVEGVFWRMSAVAAGLSGAALVLMGGLPRVRAWWGEGAVGEAPPSSPPSRVERWWILGAWCLAHLPFVVIVPPLIQFDSRMNVLEPDLFLPALQPLHHPPLYSELIKAAAQAPTLLSGLTCVVVLQHGLVALMGLTASELVRRVGSPSWVSIGVGMALVIDGTFVVYAQLIMSEVLATTLLLGAATWLVRAEEEGPAGTRLQWAGGLAAAATLTRQVTQLWFVIGIAWLVILAVLRGRRRASMLLGLAACGPVLALMTHQYVFSGRFSLTAASGRSLVQRIAVGLPDLTDPHAPPGDQMERARRIVWRELGPDGWAPVHRSLREELGWDDDQITAAIRTFYLEQVRRHPLAFAVQTSRGAWRILRGSERFLSDIFAFHDRVRGQSPPPWSELPAAGSPPRALLVFDHLTPTQWSPVLALAALSPLLASGRPRRLAILCLATAAYLIAIPALFEEGLPRYRMPAVPFLAMAAGLAVGGSWSRLRPSA